MNRASRVSTSVWRSAPQRPARDLVLERAERAPEREELAVTEVVVGADEAGRELAGLDEQPARHAVAVERPSPRATARPPVAGVRRTRRRRGSAHCRRRHRSPSVLHRPQPPVPATIRDRFGHGTSPKPVGQGCGSLARSRPSARSRSSCTCIQTVWYESMRGDVNHSCSPASTRSSAARSRRGYASNRSMSRAMRRSDGRGPLVERAQAVDHRPVVPHVGVVVGHVARPHLPVVTHAEELDVQRQEPLVAARDRDSRSRCRRLARAHRSCTTRPSPVIRYAARTGRHEPGFDQLGDDDRVRRAVLDLDQPAKPHLVEEDVPLGGQPHVGRHGGRCYRVRFCGRDRQRG